MAEESKFGGFESAFDAFLPIGDSNEHSIDPEDIKKEMEKFDDLESNKSDDKNDEPNTEDKNTPDKSTKPDNNKKSVEKVDDVSSTDIDDKKSIEDDELTEVEYDEEELVDTFADLFVEELDWKFEEGEKPKSVKELVEYMKDIIEENSAPKYASDEVKELDDFVKRGGDLGDFYKKVYSAEINIDKVDLTKESNQKAVIKENLQNRGYSPERIEKLISRYEDADKLEEEATDSLEEIKEQREKNKVALLETQKKQEEVSIKQQQELISSVQKLIEDATDIRGVELSKKEKQDLIEYIFKPERDGATKYQKAYQSDLRNLVESAFFTMKGKDFVQQIQKKATADATKSLKLKLKTKGKSTKNTVSDQDSNNKVTQLWEIAGRELKNF
jgi:hypothetical protein